MQPTEIDAMISTVQAQHARLHEAWNLLHPQRADDPALYGTINVLTSTISAHLDALYMLRTLTDPKGA